LDSTELLFYSIEGNDFKTVHLLLKYGIQINKRNRESKNIIEYLIENRKLDSKNLLFILNMVKDASLITSEVLCHLIELRERNFIKEIFVYKYFDVSFVINILLAYKNKTRLSNRKLRNIIYNSNHGIININSKTKNGDFPLLYAINNNNVDMVELLIDYANENNIILELNTKNRNGDYPLLLSMYWCKFKIVKLLMDYANNHSIILELNEKNRDGYYPFLKALYDKYNIKMVKLLIEYANKNNITLELKDKDHTGNYPLLLVLYWSEFEKVKVLMDYANKHHIILELKKK